MVKCSKIRVDPEKDVNERVIFRQRQSCISPELVGKNCFVHNGLKLISIRVIKQMVGFRFGSYIACHNKRLKALLDRKRKNKLKQQ